MCYFLYGTIDGDVNTNLFNNLNNKKYFRFKLGTYTDLITSIKMETDIYRLTTGMCDCDTHIGSNRTSSKEINEYSEFIQSLNELKNIKNLYICKKWYNEEIEENIELHIDDIEDLNAFFANMKPNILYKIGVYKKYY